MERSPDRRVVVHDGNDRHIRHEAFPMDRTLWGPSRAGYWTLVRGEDERQLSFARGRAHLLALPVGPAGPWTASCAEVTEDFGTITPARSARRTRSATDPARIFSITRARCT